MACLSLWAVGSWILRNVLASTAEQCLCGLLRAQSYHSLLDIGVLRVKRDARIR
jgi:hypothetical protein